MIAISKYIVIQQICIKLHTEFIQLLWQFKKKNSNEFSLNLAYCPTVRCCYFFNCSCSNLACFF